MTKISERVSESLDEYLVLTDWIERRPEEISLQADLGSISLQYPLITARMQCIVGPEMARAAGRQGILTIVPRSLRDEDKQKILDANKDARLRKGDIEFQIYPEYASPNSTFKEVMKQVKRTGYSVIPIMDRKSKLEGVYIHNPENPPLVPPYTPIAKVMQHLNDGSVLREDKSEQEIKQILQKQERRFLPITDENGILQKIAFLSKFDTNYIGMAVKTRGNWIEEIEHWGEQVDTLTIDTSNACFSEALEILKYTKQKFPDKPFGIGNIIQGRDFLKFAKAGADYIIGGMGVGSICKTGSERGNGRGQMTVAIELAEARDAYFRTKGKYVPFVLDGGIRNIKDMCVALTLADFIMLGNYFNGFYEAAAQKFDKDKQLTNTELNIEYVESWGEGHPRARFVALGGVDFRRALAEGRELGTQEVSERYGHSAITGATVEGIVGLVKYKGRLKPNVENDARYIRTTISNTGAEDLKTYREKAVLEKASARTIQDMLPHDVEVLEE